MNDRHHLLSRRTRSADLLILVSLGAMVFAALMAFRGRRSEVLALAISGLVAGTVLLLADRYLVRSYLVRRRQRTDEPSDIDLRTRAAASNDESTTEGEASSHSASESSLDLDLTTRLTAAQTSEDQTVLEKLADDESAEVRAAVAERVESESILQRLARDADVAVKQIAQIRLKSPSHRMS